MNDEPQLQAWTPGEPWRRLLASLADLIFFLPVNFAIAVAIETSLAWRNAAPLLGAGILWTWLQLWFLVRFQGTPGKRLLGLRVFKIDGSRPGWRDAANRQILFILLLAVTILDFQHAASLPSIPPGTGLEGFLEPMAQNPSRWTWVGNAGMGVLWGSCLLLVLRSDRRAIYDLWAGTVVVRPAKSAPVVRPA